MGRVAQPLVVCFLALAPILASAGQGLARRLVGSHPGGVLGRAGDYQVGGTVFHVTVAPMPAVCEKCKVNLDRGLRAYLVAPDDQLAAARQMAESVAPGRITVTSVEAFVGQNVDEMSHFGKGVPAALRRRLRRYNERVDAVETDKSFLIDIPENL